jgi:hypothetical protein
MRGPIKIRNEKERIDQRDLEMLQRELDELSIAGTEADSDIG